MAWSPPRSPSASTMIVHLNSLSRLDGDPYEAYVDDLYAEACGRPDSATLLAVEVLFEDAAGEIGGAA